LEWWSARARWPAATWSGAATCPITCWRGRACQRPGQRRRRLDPRRASTDGLSLNEARECWLTVLEGNYLRELLDRHGGNISAATKTAGIDRKTFHRLVTKHQIR
jgi:DNA-binding NtrC family response regulator